MSKSDPSDYSRINLTDDADAIAQKIRRAKTDPHAHAGDRGRRREAARRRQSAGHLRRPRRPREGRRRSREFAGKQFSEFKAALTELAVAKLGPVGAEMQRLMKDPGHVDAVLRDGAERAAPWPRRSWPRSTDGGLLSLSGARPPADDLRRHEHRPDAWSARSGYPSIRVSAHFTVLPSIGTWPTSTICSVRRTRPSSPR